MSRIIRAALAGVVLTLAGLATAVAASGGYQLTTKIALGGDGGWDYLTYDTGAKRLFVSRGSHVMVVDPVHGTVVGDIPATGGVHGIALAPDLGRGFTSNGRDGSVTVFDLKTLQTIATVAIDQKNPDCIVYDPVSKRVFTFNGGSSSYTAIDAVTNAVIGSSPLPGRPEYAAVGDAGDVYVNIEDKSELSAIDTRKNAIVATWPLAPCESPSGLSIDVRHHRVFAGCHNNVMAMVDTTNGHVVATVPIGSGVDATAFDPATQLAFSSNGDGTLTVVHEDSPATYTVVQNAATMPSARTMALDPLTHTVYLVGGDFTVGPPASGQTRPTRTLVAGSFVLLTVAPAK